MEKTIRGQLLHDGIKLTEGDRNKQYGSPIENLGNIAVLWSAYLETKYRGRFPAADAFDRINMFTLTAEDVAHFNVLQKMARTFQPGYKADTYTDGAVYFAIAGEIRFVTEAGVE